MVATVLVIDDDATVRSSTVAYLDDCDYQVLEADSGRSGLDILESTNVDAVVCDLKMPGMHGIELLEKIKASWPQTPVLILSGAGVMDDVVRALRLGADDFLVKPIIDFEVLHHALRKALDRVRLEDENKVYRAHLEQKNIELKQGLTELRNDQLAGRQAQLKMLPEPFEFNGISCEHIIRPSLLLSGDFLDYFDINDHQIAFYIADVSGHGSSSAFVTVLLKNHTYRLKRNLQRNSSDDLLHPDLVLQRLNNELLASDLDKHLTIIFGVLCTKTLTLTYSVGGHFPLPVLVNNDNKRFLDGNGMPVGLFPDATYQLETIQLPEEFSLYLFSDGILEIIPEKKLVQKENELLETTISSGNNLESILKKFGLEDAAEVPDDIAIMRISRSLNS